MRMILKVTGLITGVLLVFIAIVVTGKQFKKYDAPYPGTDPEHVECISPNLTTDSLTGGLTGRTKEAFVSQIRI